MNTLLECKKSSTYKEWIDTDNIIAEKAINEDTVIVVTQSAERIGNREFFTYTKTRLFLMTDKWQVSIDKNNVNLDTLVFDLLSYYN